MLIVRRLRFLQRRWLFFFLSILDAILG